MSYEGYTEWLCEHGHHLEADVWQDDPKACHCGGALAYVHSVDQTNGYMAGCPCTYPASKRLLPEEDRFDLPRKDRHGNAYVMQVPRYRPTSKHWNKLRAQDGQS